METSAPNVIPIGAEVRLPTVRTKNYLLPCAFEGCANHRKAKELCSPHHRQRKLGQTLRVLRSRTTPPTGKSTICLFLNCTKPRFAKELCGAHYSQFQRGQPLASVGTIGYPFCTKCRDESKPRTIEFFRPNTNGVLGSVCRDCLRAHKQNTKDREHLNYLKRTYKVSDSWYREQIVRQEGKCAICGTFDPGGKGRWSVDHNHATGQVRELLCSGCNCAIGYAKESPETLIAAAAYIRRHI